MLYVEFGIVTTSRLSVCPSVAVRYRDHIGWNTSKIISWLITWGVPSLQTSISGIYSKKNTRNFGRNRAGVSKSGLRCTKALISLKTRPDRTKVTIEDQQEVPYALSIGAKINDFGWPWRAIIHCLKTRAPWCC